MLNLSGMARLAPQLVASTLALLSAGAAAAGEAAAPPPALAYATQSIAWYRQQVAATQLAAEPSDVVFAEAAREQARQVLSLAFDYARGALTLGAAEEPAPWAAPQPAGEESFRQHAAEVQAEISRLEAERRGLERRRSRAAGPRRAGLERRLAEVESALRFAQARLGALRSLAGFAASTGAAAGAGPLGQLEELRRSVPELAADAGGPGRPPPSVPGATAHRAAPSGVVALVSDLLTLSRKLRALEDAARLTTRLRAAAEKQRAPLLAELRALVQSAGEQGPAAQDAAAVRQRTRDLDRATSRFGKLSGAMVPLAKELVLLDAHGATLSQWRGAVDEQYDEQFRRLAIHLGLVAVAVAAILLASAFWRRATLRYVRDPRRRRQSLFVRRIVVAAAVALTLVFSFVTELGSVATFAGFITAGLAVALQNVILSLVAYFFLIGRYGIGVGDRVQIAGVTGDVIDIGLVRLHLLELREDGLPTGRVVVFSNSVLFQPAANFFKQAPGSSFTWHEVKLTLSAATDHRRAERRLLGAVEEVYRPYRAAIEQQHDAMASQLSPLPVHHPEPQSHLRLTESGLELTIRFPVPLDRGAAIDDQVTRALLEAIDREPHLQLAGSGKPTIEAAPAGAQAPA